MRFGSVREVVDHPARREVCHRQFVLSIQIADFGKKLATEDEKDRGFTGRRLRSEASSPKMERYVR
jgi:hypothetical protein